MHLLWLNYEKLLSWLAGTNLFCLFPAGGAPEPMPVQRVSALHSPALPHQMDQ